MVNSHRQTTRIETAFGIPASKLLMMQEVYQSSTQESEKITENTQRYVPPFMEIKACDITAWASSKIEARQELPVLLRYLVNSTGRQLRKVDFPGNDHAQQPGADGFVEAEEGSPWVPKGSSWWEMGTSVDAESKAKRDFEKRTKELTEEERSQLTFVFVTPQTLSSKKELTAKWKNESKWKDIRIYDVSDLEQWIEQSIPAQVWCSTRLSKVKFRVRTLEQCCREWCKIGFADDKSTLTDDKSTLTDDIWKDLFAESVERWKETIQTYLASNETRHFTIEAHSPAEALTFLYYALDTKEGHYYQDRIAFFDEVGVLPTLIQGPIDFIPVIAKQEVKDEVEGCLGKKIIFICPPNYTSGKNDVSLGVVSAYHFEITLGQHGKHDQDIKELKKKSGRSLTVLRRNLLPNRNIRKPNWVTDVTKHYIILSLAFLGNIDINNPHDKELFLKMFAMVPTVSVETVFAHLDEIAREEESPVWKVGNCYGVYSKLDVLLSMQERIATDYVGQFLKLAETVIKADDSKSEFSTVQYFHTPLLYSYKDGYRHNLAETFALLSIYVDPLFEPHQRHYVRNLIASTIESILSPFSTKTLQANNRELALYAEAAPKRFLSLANADLNQGGNALHGIMKSELSGLMVDCPPREGVLHALEGLGWKKDFFSDVVKILGALSANQINDRYSEPYRSLRNLLSPFRPQTLAPIESRQSMVDQLFYSFPEIGWRLALDMVRNKFSRLTGDNHLPEWLDCGGKVSWSFAPKEEQIAILNKLECGLINHQTNTLEKIQALIGIAKYMSLENQDKVILLIENFCSEDQSDEGSRATVYETIQFNFFSKLSKIMFQKLPLKDCRDKWHTLAKRIKPKDPVLRWAWLFDRGLIDDTRLGLPENYTQNQFDKRVNQLRSKAITEILTAKQLEGIWQLCQRGIDQSYIGWFLASQVLTKSQIVQLVDEYLKFDLPKNPEQDFMRGLLVGIPDTDKHQFYSDLVSQYRGKAIALLLLAPFQLVTWKVVNKLTESEQTQYWSQVTPLCVHPEDLGKEECIRQLLAVQRPRAAFRSMRFCFGMLDLKILVELLKRMVLESDEPFDKLYFKDDIKAALTIIQKYSNSISEENLVNIELFYLPCLIDYNEPNVAERIPHLAKYIEDHPEFYASLMRIVYQDTSSLSDHEKNQKEAWKEIASFFLYVFDRIPGLNQPTREGQKQMLSQWVTTVRELCQQVNLGYEADLKLGQLLAHAFVGKEEVFPIEAVCDVVEEIGSDVLTLEIAVGVKNARGPHPIDTGAQERELEHRYKKVYESLNSTHPFVASSILQLISDEYEEERYQADYLAKVRKLLAR